MFRIVLVSFLGGLAGSGPAEAQPSLPLHILFQYCWGGTLDPQNLDDQCDGTWAMYRLNNDHSVDLCENGGSTLGLRWFAAGDRVTIDFTPNNNDLWYSAKHVGGGRLGGIMTDAFPVDPLNEYRGVWDGHFTNAGTWNDAGCP